MSDIAGMLLRLGAISIALLVCAIVALALAFPEMRRCKALSPGATEADLIAAVGKPVGHESRAGETWTVYPQPFAAAGPVRAVIHAETREVLALRCTEDGAPEW